MARTRTRLIAVVAVVVVLAAAAFVLTTGETPVIKIIGGSNVLKIEAAGVNYGGWPDMSVRVNGKEIAVLTVESKVRTMYEVSVPDDVGTISEIEIKMPNETDCSKADFSLMAACTNRTLIVRGVYLNDEKLEGAVASGERNLASSLQTSAGGITWQVAQ